MARKTALICGALAAFFIVWDLLSYALLGSESPYIMSATVSGTACDISTGS